MRNLFAADYFKNEATGEETKNFNTVKQWLKDDKKVIWKMRELSHYFELDVNYEVEDIVEQDGAIYIKAVGYLFPFIGFTDNVHVLKSWKISDVTDGKLEKPHTNYTRDLDVAKEQLKEGKVLVCTFTTGHTSKIVSFENMGGVDYIRTYSGSKYILQPIRPSQHFRIEGVLKWPSEVA